MPKQERAKKPLVLSSGFVYNPKRRCSRKHLTAEEKKNLGRAYCLAYYYKHREQRSEYQRVYMQNYRAKQKAILTEEKAKTSTVQPNLPDAEPVNVTHVSTV